MNATHSTPHKLPLPANFTPARNAFARVSEYGETYFGSFTGRVMTDGSFEVYFRDRAGDARWSSTSQVEVSTR